MPLTLATQFRNEAIGHRGFSFVGVLEPWGAFRACALDWVETKRQSFHWSRYLREFDRGSPGN